MIKLNLILNYKVYCSMAMIMFLTALTCRGYCTTGSVLDNASDSIYLEAESGAVEAPMAVFGNEQASGGQYVMAPAGNESTGVPPAMGKVSLTVSLNAGTYKIWGRVITPTGSNDSFWISVNGENPYRWNSIGDHINWSWQPVHDSDNGEQIISWELEAGEHTIDFYYRESQAQLDEVYISRFDDTPTKGDSDVATTIYVSQQLGNDSNNGLSEQSPIKTLHQAYQMARSMRDDVANFQILLRGGETYTDFQPIFGLDEGGGPSYFAFVWNINRRLTLSTYGPDEKAHLLGGAHKHEGGPTQGVLVINPSTQDVLIENLFFEMWQEGALMVFETEDVHIRNIKINKIGTYYFPGEQTPRGSSFPYTAGVVYPKNSTRILMEDIVMTNCHNVFDDVSGLHGFYGTRLNHSEIRNCYLKNVSGSPFKFRRSPANNVYVHDNECYYTGHTTFESSWDQPGFLRYSGDAGGNCPFALTFENNVFHYPFCWSENGEDCTTTETILCSVSNTGSCGEDACTNPERVKWIDNNIIYTWAPGSTEAIPEIPPNFSGVGDTESSILLSWYDINLNETAYVVEKKVNDQYVELVRLPPNSIRYRDQNLNSETSFEYRVYAENVLGKSDYTQTIMATTKVPNRAPNPDFTTSATEGTLPLTVRFDASTSSDPDGDSFLYAWTIDGAFVGNRDTLSYVFEDAGVYTVTLILEDQLTTSQKSVEIKVNQPLNAEMNFQELKVFPNPTNGTFFIKGLPKGTTLKAYNLLGKRISLFGPLNSKRESYVLSKGIYFIKFFNQDAQIASRKLIVR
ncbi:MAG: PKD domain-containing protein [Bacteroidota bacterium]